MGTGVYSFKNFAALGPSELIEQMLSDKTGTLTTIGKARPVQETVVRTVTTGF